jgi:hypothetical protein
MSSDTVHDAQARGRFGLGLVAARSRRTSLNQATGHSLDIEPLLALAQAESPVRSLSDDRRLCPQQARELADLVRQIERLGAALSRRSGVPHRRRPAPELRLRPPP